MLNYMAAMAVEGERELAGVVGVVFLSFFSLPNATIAPPQKDSAGETRQRTPFD